MSTGMFQYGIGGNEVKPDSSEAINEISGNRTLIAQKLTADDPLMPESVQGLTTVEEVFSYFKPNIDVSFETEDGRNVQENLIFSNLGDFTARKITERSPFLTDLNVQKEQYAKITKQLKSNKVLRSMLENPETRRAFIDALQTLAAELDAEK